MLVAFIIEPSVSASGTGSLTVDDVKNMLPSGIDAINITVFGGYDSYVTILLPFADNLFGNKYILIGAQKDATDIFKELFKDHRVNTVTVETQVPLVDVYGKEEMGIGTSYSMRSATAAKIDWDNFLYSNLDGVADNVWIHHAMRG